jgi:TonB-linked SusC/RagA family outer membrane protein
MKRKLQLFCLLLALWGATLPAYAQQIKGKVIAAKDGLEMPGVTILLKGTATGTVTNSEGEFTITAKSGDVLVISSLGYVSQEITLGNESTLSISLEEDVKTLGEVVVTALGIKKETRKLGFAATSISSSDISINRTTNFMNTLQGKIAGVNISALSTGPGGTSKVRVRGQSSFYGQNNPLIVINGIPINNSNFSTNLGNAGSDNSFGPRGGGGISSDGGDGLSSINPDDIEDMTVLKGAAASALYGSRAKDGVIMITTKTKGDGKGIGITYNMNYTNETPLDFTDYQYEYGQGENGVRPTTANPTSGQWSFGEKFQPGMTQVLFDNVTVPYVPQRDIIRNFFRNGQNINHSVSLTSANDKGSMFLSLSNLDSRGIVPNNKFNRKTINFGFNYILSKNISFSGNLNYSNEYNQNPPNIGNQDNTIPVALYNMANSMPLDLLEAKKYDAAGNEFVYSRFRNRTNPYWTLAEQFQNIRRDRIFGNITIKYNILPWLYIQGRVGQDYWSRDEDYNNFPTGQASRAAAPVGFVNGIYTQETRRFRELNTDFLTSANRQFGNFGVEATFGGNHMYRRGDYNSVQVTDFVVRDLYTVTNGRVKDPQYSFGETVINSLYGALELSYKNTVFISGTLRNDWFSTLRVTSILYPSISGSYVFSESFKGTSSWLNFGKLRLAYAEVGSDGDVPPYSNQLYYGINANLFNGQPIGGSTSSTLPNKNLRPMRAGELEAGLDLRLFNNRLNIDFAVYRKVTKDQIVAAQISDASGFTNTLINSGKSRTQGIELLINYGVIKKDNFQWNFILNGSYNITRILSVINDIPGGRLTTGTHVFNGELRQVVGQEMSQIYGFGYLRNANGQIIYGANGLPRRTPDLISFGSALPKWVGGITNNFKYKDLSLSFLIDFKLGNKMLSGTNFNAIRHGLHKMTLPGRENGYKIVGVGVNENGEPNTVQANVQPFWEVVRSQALVEPAVYNGGYWKLRQITIGYNFTKFLPKNLFIKSINIGLVANNVLMLKKWIDNIDPESFSFSSDNVQGLESTGLPTTRSLGFNLSVKL